MTGPVRRRMRAVCYARVGPARAVLEQCEVDTPVPGPGEVLVQVAASGVNPHDTKQRSGWLGGAAPTAPVIPHGDGSGTIVAAGEAALSARIGEDVWFHHCSAGGRKGWGSLAEYCVVSARQALPLPPGVDAATGAGLGVPGLTAFDAVFGGGGDIAGQTLLVTGGAGAVAGYAIGLARRAGARVLATVSSEAKAAQARAFGASETIDYRREDVAARVLALTAGAGVERIVEVDFGANIAVSAKVIRPHGVIASYSSSRVREPVFPYYALTPKAVTVRIVQGLLLPPAIQHAGAAALAAACAEGVLVHPPVHRFPFADAAGAHEWLERGQGIGKAVVMIGAD